MNLDHLAKGPVLLELTPALQICSRCYWGRQRLLFLIIACCHKPLVLECFSSSQAHGLGESAGGAVGAK